METTSSLVNILQVDFVSWLCSYHCVVCPHIGLFKFTAREARTGLKRGHLPASPPADMAYPVDGFVFG